jgi:lysophospholipase L1-like esterase
MEYSYLWGIGCVVVALLTVRQYLLWQATRSPPGCLTAAAKRPKAPAGTRTIVCLGDSNTHARVAGSYVQFLGQRLPAHRILNGGCNGNCAYNLLQRVEECRAVDPALITVMIGTNDAKATLSVEASAYSVKDHKLPRPPSLAAFRDDLAQLLVGLRKRCSKDTQVALLTLPPLGEGVGSDANLRAAQFNAVIVELAGSHGCRTVDVHGDLMRVCAAPPLPKEAPASWTTYDRRMRFGVILHYLLGFSWDAVSALYGARCLTDGLHINDSAAGVIANRIAKLVEETEDKVKRS